MTHDITLKDAKAICKEGKADMMVAKWEVDPRPGEKPIIGVGHTTVEALGCLLMATIATETGGKW